MRPVATAIGDLVARLRMDTSGFRRSARGATGPMRLMGGAAGALTGTVGALTASLIGAGGLSFAFIRAGKSANDFAGEMNRSVAIMKDVNAEIRADMERTAESVSFSTKFSAKEAAGAYFFLASAGLDAAQSIAALPRVAKFAQAGNFDLSLATDLATDALSALGLKSNDAAENARNLQHVMDNLVEANRNANASVQQFSEALTNKAGAAMRLLGIEIEEGLALLSVWADQGVKAQDAGTRMDIVLRDLTAKAILNADAFEKAGIAVFEFGEIRNIADIVQDMERRMLGMTDRGRKAELMLLGFTNKTVNATASLLGFSDAIRQYEENQNGAAGATEEVADNMTDLDASWAKAAASIERANNDFFPSVLDGFADIIDVMTGSQSEFDKVTEKVNGLTRAGNALGKTFSAAAKGMGAFFDLLSAERQLNNLRNRVREVNRELGISPKEDNLATGQDDQPTPGKFDGIIQFLQEEFDKTQEEIAVAQAKLLVKANAMGARLFQETRTPMEQFTQRIKDINNLLRVGALGTGQTAADTAARGRAAALTDLQRAQSKSQIEAPRLAAAQEKGTSEAFSTIFQAQNNPALRVAMDQLSVQRQQLEVQRQIAGQGGARPMEFSDASTRAAAARFREQRIAEMGGAATQTDGGRDEAGFFRQDFMGRMEAPPRRLGFKPGSPEEKGEFARLAAAREKFGKVGITSEKGPNEQLKVNKEQLIELKRIARKLETQETVSIPAG